MRARVRPTAAPALACGVLASALVLAGCGGDGDDKAPAAPAASGATTTPPVSVPSAPASVPPAAGQPTLPAVPKVKAGQVKPLVGRWVSPAGDYFQFKADGTGSWMKGGQSLWNGQVIPEGKGRFRFSWQGGDPKSASYWGATLTGGKLLFAGTNQTYTKAKG
ncbi:hypothetical protein GCM10010191_83000 [Actinomadura vinacea]|uniref:Uncharacterized protein n=1 Tax=Actinomadura vinacea TaxID=115336 RepID=A0ABN3K7X9_9ACTN